MSSPSRSIQNSAASTPSDEPEKLVPQPPKRPTRPNPPAQPAAEARLDKPTAPKAPVKPLPRPNKPKPIAKVVKLEAAEPIEPPADAGRMRPIPPPSEPRQFRAIGLVRGKYTPSEDQFTCGTFIAEDGAEIDAVLLGRVMSLIKKHVDLDESHLWVAYPRTQQESESLHLQIVGIWEPETLSKDDEDDSADEADRADSAVGSDKDAKPPLTSTEVEDDNYFSIRGEVVFYSEERACTVVKIRQAPRKKGETPRFFKLSLSGKIEGRTLAHFWDFHVRRNGTVLEIERSECLGPMPPKPKSKRGGGGRKKPFNKKGGDSVRGRDAKPSDRPKPQLRLKTTEAEPAESADSAGSIDSAPTAPE
ncbi:MAG: hypothetical protein ACFB9N_15010 [Geitlerinemataceae cyanobacterium]